MKLGTGILNGILGAAICVMPLYGAQNKNCDDKYYARANPTICKKSDTGVFGIAVGGAVAVGAGLLFASLGGSSAESSSNGSARMMTTQRYDTVGFTDTDSLNAVLNNAEYNLNYDHYNEIRLAYSLARGYTGQGSTIGILDATDSWHGVAVANVASSVIAPDAQIQMHKVAFDTKNFYSYSAIADVISSATDVDVFNSSWNMNIGASTIRSRARIEQLTGRDFIQSMVTSAQRDAIFVWSAGNDGNTQSGALSAMPLVVPELAGHFINVVAFDTATGELADYSNQCGVTMNYCITAPGTNIDTGKYVADGTSFAAPMVTGAVAVLQEAFPYMTANDITQLLFATARDLGYEGVDEVYGWGMLDLERATRPVGSALVPLDGGMQVLRTASASGAIGRKLKSANLEMAFFDSFGRAFTTKLSDNISFNDRGRGFERLRMTEPRVTFSAGNLEFGFSNENLLQADGFLQTAQNNLISFVGFQNGFNIGQVNFMTNARIGFSAPATSAESFVSDISNMYSGSVKFGANWRDWKIEIATPETIIGGTMALNLPTGRGDNGDILFKTYNVNLAERPAMEYSVGYKFLTASYINNTVGKDEFFMMAKGSVAF